MRFGIDTAELKQDIWLIEVMFSSLLTIAKERVVVYAPIPRFPSVERDLSFLIGCEISYGDIRDTILQLDKTFIRSLNLVDEYRGKQVPDGLRSLTIRLELNNYEKTLTDEQVEKDIAKVLDVLTDKWNAKLR